MIVAEVCYILSPWLWFWCHLTLSQFQLSHAGLRDEQLELWVSTVGQAQPLRSYTQR